jgi:hypothetical protein
MGGGLDGKAFRLSLTGDSALSAPVQSRVFSEVSAGWNLSGNCDPLLGDVMVSGEGLVRPIQVPCSGVDGGKFLRSLADADFIPGISSKRVMISQPPASSDLTILYRSSSINSPVFVSSAAELQAMQVNAQTTYILTRDIDLAAEVGSSENFQPLGAFTNGFRGQLEGDLRTISNISSSGGVGLFNAIGGTFTQVLVPGVHNLKIQTAKISLTLTGSSVNTNYFAGGVLAGSLVNASVTHCSVNDFEVLNGNNTRMGGLFGWVDNSRIEAVSLNQGRVGHLGSGFVGGFSGVVSGSRLDRVSISNVTITGSGYVGGLIGERNTVSGPALMTNSSSQATVIGVFYRGGLIGRDSSSDGVIQNSYFNGIIEDSGAGQFLGPLVGGYYPAATAAATAVQNSFYEINSFCARCTSQGLPVNLQQGVSPSTFSAWNFSQPIWQLNGPHGSPSLFTEVPWR